MHVQFFTVQCYAIAVHAMALCPSVCAKPVSWQAPNV